MVREKEKEGDELRASIAESNEESEANIEMKRRQTQNNIKVYIILWNFDDDKDDEKREKCTKFAFSELNGRALRSRSR